MAGRSNQQRSVNFRCRRGRATLLVTVPGAAASDSAPLPEDTRARTGYDPQLPPQYYQKFW
ncbi:Uncharacterized protein APZ42_032091 [Daphnia magna]|uniref:Uncharacterized protein n=1 Tax=Daphnia magna TaxID=35525 RepID=A0A0P5V6H8_9CRUS|nr:Uncharacterized protein APZ42_032091 [Daphnia magna]